MTKQSPQRILVADDEPLYRETTAEFLREEGFECICVENADDAITVLKEMDFDLILTDLNMPGNLKLELLREGRETYAHVPMIVITGVPSISSAIESVRLGITDYLLKPIKLDELLVAVKRAIEQKPSNRGAPITGPQDVALPTQTVHGATTLHRAPPVVGESDGMREVFEIVSKVAQGNANVLVTGESGTGKEVIAEMIHRLSARSERGFQVIDCTAIPDTLFESVLFGHTQGAFTGAIKDQAGLLRAADGGTAFFDEIGELPMPLQAKLLRVVQSQTFTAVGSDRPAKIDTRFICATNRNLSDEVEAGRFRQDLFYRLAVIHIQLPPLRERGQDIVRLAETFLQQLLPAGSNLEGFSEEAIESFLRYRWPGNVRELRNVVERSIALAQGTNIRREDLPVPLQNPNDTADQDWVDLTEISRDEALDRADRDYLTKLLRKHQGVIARAARQAGLSRQGMHKLLNRHGIIADDFRSP
ncbi:sigma-54 dependent transcriptional regulator [Roseiconus lacunae]|uniref:sigma-54-dependent transcriptional regulator n=1 Tax=Roseiconus lacunae TaxID=2605694 RepID=UPI0030871BD1|nr:sigma-54 dependent transcriptional regulator [Stieleria sp. HD01]